MARPTLSSTAGRAFGRPGPLAGALLLAGCAAATAPAAPAAAPAAATPQAATPRALALDGVVIRTEVDPLTQLEVYDADELFHIARERARTDRLDDAILVYRRLLDEFAHSALAEPATYNLGLLYEKKGDFSAAVPLYLGLATRDAPAEGEPRRTWLDSHFRVAVCFGKLGEWWRSVAAFDAVLAEPWIGDPDRLEAMVGRGISLQEAGEPESAEIELSAVLRFAREAEERRSGIEQGLVAEAAFRLGEIAADGYRKVVLEFPIEVLRVRLEEKCEKLLSAQHRYLRAIRHGDAHTVAAAGFRIGSLYESLYDTIVALQVPADLTEEQAGVYHEEVHKRVNVLLEKALRVYEQALLIGRTATTAADWTTRLEASIARLRGLYLELADT